MKLIVNADDFGFSKGVNQGIYFACQKGIVNSVSVMTNMPQFHHAIYLLKKMKNVDVGVHVNLTSYKPLSKNYFYCDKKGMFMRFKDEVELNMDEIEEECYLQIQRLLNEGIIITHLDSHHHAHGHQKVMDIFLYYAKKYRLKIRNIHSNIPNEFQRTSAFTEDFFDEGATREHFLTLIDHFKKEESLEIMCHPAFLDDKLEKYSSYHIKRYEEYGILTNEEIKKELEKRKILF